MLALTVGSTAPAQAQNRSRLAGAQSSLEKEVRHELVMLPYYGVFDNLAFRVNGSQVELYGQVTRPTLKSDAERVVRQIEGVEKVANNIESCPFRLTTTASAWTHIVQSMDTRHLNRYSLQAVPPIHIIVKNGQLALEGVVANEMDKNIANVQANSVPGVFSVTNNLRVETSGAAEKPAAGL